MAAKVQTLMILMLSFTADSARIQHRESFRPIVKQVRPHQARPQPGAAVKAQLNEPGAPVDAGANTRRAVLSKVFGGAALLAANPQLAHAVKATTGLSSQFTGDYNDPNHPECLRTIKVVGAKVGPDGRKSRNPSAYVTGWDGPEDPKLAGLNGEVYSLQTQLSEAETAAKAAAEAAAKAAPAEGAAEEAAAAAKAADAAAKAAEAKAAEAKSKLDVATAARDKVAMAKRACVGRPEQSDVWKLTSTVAEDDSAIRIDFSPKGGPANLVGKAENLAGEMAIVFPDGNRWTKVPQGTPERRPKELKTKSSD